MAETSPAYGPENLAEFEEGKVIRLRSAEIEFVPEEESVELSEELQSAPVETIVANLEQDGSRESEGRAVEASSGEVLESVEKHLADLAKDARRKIEEIYTQPDEGEPSELPIAA